MVLVALTHFFSLHNALSASYKEKSCPVFVPFFSEKSSKLLSINLLQRFCGGYRIRTCGAFQPTCFRDKHHKPLGQSSVFCDAKLINFGIIINFLHANYSFKDNFLTDSGIRWMDSGSVFRLTASAKFRKVTSLTCLANSHSQTTITFHPKASSSATSRASRSLFRRILDQVQKPVLRIVIENK